MGNRDQSPLWPLRSLLQIIMQTRDSNSRGWAHSFSIDLLVILMKSQVKELCKVLLQIAVWVEETLLVTSWNLYRRAQSYINYATCTTTHPHASTVNYTRSHVDGACFCVGVLHSCPCPFTCFSSILSYSLSGHFSHSLIVSSVRVD